MPNRQEQKHNPIKENKNDMDNRPLVYQDVHDLCYKLQVTPQEFESFYGHKILNKPMKAIITKANLDHVVRFLHEFPEQTPFIKVSFDEVVQFFKKHVVDAGLSSTLIPTILGIKYNTYHQYKAKQHYLNKQMAANFLTYKAYIEKQGLMAVVKLVMIANVFQQPTIQEAVKPEIARKKKC